MQSSFANEQAPLLLIDENLADSAIAQALRLVEYNAHAVSEVLSPGIDDPTMISWLGLQRGIWITADDRAKLQHAKEIHRAGINVLWIRRPKASGVGLNKRDQLLLLLWVLDPILEELARAHGPRYFRAYYSGKRPRYERIG